MKRLVDIIGAAVDLVLSPAVLVLWFLEAGDRRSTENRSKC